MFQPIFVGQLHALNAAYDVSWVWKDAQVRIMDTKHNPFAIPCCINPYRLLIRQECEVPEGEQA